MQHSQTAMMMLSMLNSKKRNKNIRRSLVLALGFVCIIGALAGCSQNEQKQQKVKDSFDIKKAYSEYVTLNKGAVLYEKNDKDKFKKAVVLKRDRKLQLAAKQDQNMKQAYFKLLNYDMYVDAHQVKKSEAFIDPVDYIPYLPFQENLKTKKNYTLYDEAGKAIAQINKSSEFPIYMKDQDRYGIRIKDTLYFIKAEDSDGIAAADNGTSAYADRVPVLMYHAFYDKINPPANLNGNYVEHEEYREQLKYLYDNGYTTLRMIDVERFLDGKVLVPVNSIAITMDDGYDNEYTIGSTVLKEFGMKGTAFLITNWYEDGKLSDYWQLAQENGLELQSHSHAMHAGGCKEKRGGAILCIDEAAGVADIETSRTIIGGDNVFVFCYPYGDFNDHAKQILRNSGMRMAFTTQPGWIQPGMDKLELPRVRVFGGAGLDRFIKNLER